MLGFATRAGKIIVGTELVCAAMPKGKVKLTVLSGTASESTKKTLTTKSEFYGIAFIVTEIDSAELARVIGKESNVAAVAVTDERFASEILKLFAQYLDERKLLLRRRLGGFYGNKGNTDFKEF